MIYRVYEKFIELTENYKVWDYITYLVFVVFVLVCTLFSVTFAAGKYSLDSTGLTYTITQSTYTGNINLPPVQIDCPSRDKISIAFKVKVTNYIANQIIDVSVLDKENDKATLQFHRFPEGTEYTINYVQDLGDIDLNSLTGLFLETYPYSTNRTINIHGEFNKGMQLQFYNLTASSKDHGSCQLRWIVKAN